MTVIVFEVLAVFTQGVWMLWSLSNPMLYPEKPISPPIPWLCHVTETLSVPRKPRCCTDGHQQIWDISFSDNSGLSFVLLDTAIRCFSSYILHWTPFIANFLCLLTMNEHFSLLMQIQSFSTPRHSLRSAALWSAAHSQLRPDAGKMLCMGCYQWEPWFCSSLSKFPFIMLLWGEFSTSQLLCFPYRSHAVFHKVFPVDIYLCTYWDIYIYLNTVIYLCIYTSVCICRIICSSLFRFFWSRCCYHTAF